MSTPLLGRWHQWCLLMAAVILLALSPQMAFATVNVVLNAGYLRQNATTAMTATTDGSNNGGGALLLLVAAGGNGGTTFTNSLSSGQYVAGGDLILAEFGFDNYIGTSSDGTGQITNNSVTFTLPSTGVTPGTTQVELRWFPSITLSQYGTVFPTAGSSFGNYNPQVYHPGGSLNPDGGNTWTVPADSSNVTLNFYTTDDTARTNPAASQAPSEGYASFTVVPEPSVFIWLGGGAGITALLRRKRRASLS